MDKNSLIVFLVIGVAILSVIVGYLICKTKTEIKMRDLKIKLMKVDLQLKKESLAQLKNQLNKIDGDVEQAVEVLSFNSKEEMDDFINNIKNHKGEK